MITDFGRETLRNCFYQREKSLFIKFWEKVLVDDDDKCWEWNASKNKKGYGNFYISVGHSKDKHCLSHRMAYKFRYGDFDESLFVCHKCDNPSCVNPSHLFLGTNQDNMNDKKEKGRINGQIHGEKNSNAKLKEKDIIRIRKLYNPRKYTLNMLAKEYNVHHSTIGYIINRRLWDHVK